MTKYASWQYWNLQRESHMRYVVLMNLRIIMFKIMTKEPSI